MSRRDSHGAIPPRAGPGAALAMRIARLQQQALAQAEAGRPRRALEACREILSLQPTRPDVLAFAGTAALGAGDAAAGAAYYKRALALRPDFVEAHYNLGNALDALGRAEEAVVAYRKALALRPGFVAAQHNLANALRRLGRIEAAIEAYRRALSLQQTAAGERDLGIALNEVGRFDEAIAAWRRALSLPEHRSDLWSNLANALLEIGDAAGALEACDRYLEADPGNVEGLALKALALNETGDRAGAEALLDFDGFVQVVDFTAAPPGYADLAAFNAALVAHVEAHPSLAVPPKDHPTYHNDALEITGELLIGKKGAMADFETIMRSAIADYLAQMPTEPRHPFPSHFPKRWRLAAWATRLNGQGHLDPHIHFSGYLGGVYYPLLPEIVGRDDAGQAGWFELGRPPQRLSCRAPPLVRPVQPRPGRLILFPGYFFHRTIPFAAAERRISIAFDLVPQD